MGIIKVRESIENYLIGKKFIHVDAGLRVVYTIESVKGKHAKVSWPDFADPSKSQSTKLYVTTILKSLEDKTFVLC